MSGQGRGVVSGEAAGVRRLRWGAVVVVAVAVTVVIAAPAVAAQEPCGVPAAPSWTPAEVMVWQHLCVGEWADLNAGGKVLDPSQPDGWDDRRMLSSAFIERLLTQPYAAVIDRRGIRIGGAWFPDGLDITEASTGFPLRCQDCRIATLQADNAAIDGTLDLRGSAIEGDLSLRAADISGDLDMRRGSAVSGTLNAERATVADSVFLDEGSRSTDINLIGADIGGTFDVGNGSAVSGTLNADGLTVAGSVSLHGNSRFNDISLLDADIGGNLDATGGSMMSGALTADRARVAGSVFLHGGSEFNDIDLLSADIGGNLEVGDESVVSGTLNADGLSVAGGVFLRDGSRFTDVSLLGADIGGLIHLDGAKWEPGGSLALEQARAGGIRTDDRADSWPATLWLNGLTFRGWASPNPRTLGADWFTDVWLARLDTFSPGPYNQLAAVMDATGHPTIAADIRYRRSHLERLEVPWTRPDRWGRQAHWLVLGYGYRPWRALGWLFAVWLIGFVAFRLRLHPVPPEGPGETAERPGRLRRWRAGLARLRPTRAPEWSAGQAALYSLDRLLPAVKLADPDQFPKRTHAQEAWSVVQMLLGWLLTLFIVGWLGGLLV